ncbi:MAG: DoxX family membrane protein [Candidatus Dadabacteria bacterium]|nr:DoxX family membrane protein [Candidatus Dadabacteria bacterium]
MLRFLFHTNGEFPTFFARVFLGTVILPHGLQKLLGMFGGNGFDATVKFFVEGGLPEIVAILIIVGESVGAACLIIGFMARICAVGIITIMTGAIVTVHAQYGFFMNWFGTQQGQGYEYHLLAIGLGLAVLVGGSGKFSIDRFITNKLVF